MPGAEIPASSCASWPTSLATASSMRTCRQVRPRSRSCGCCGPPPPRCQPGLRRSWRRTGASWSTSGRWPPEPPGRAACSVWEGSGSAMRRRRRLTGSARPSARHSPLVTHRTQPWSTAAPVGGRLGDEPLIVEQREAGWSAAVGALALESGEQRPASARLPGDLPLGWHRLVHTGGERRLVVAPDACHLPDWLARGGRARGWAAQLYALRSRRSWGIGDLGDLARLAGGPDRPDFVLLNPLHYAPATADSPYYPSSRMFHNPLYLEVETVPEVEALPAPDRERLAGLGATGRALTAERLLDRVAVWRCKDEALRACWDALRRRPERLAAFERWRGGAPDLEVFAGFCALQEERPGDWHTWPAELRHPGSPAVAAWRAANA